MRIKILLSALLITVICGSGGCGIFKREKPAFLSPEESAALEQSLANEKPPANVNIAELPELTPDTIRTAFEENPLNADAQYNQQWLKVRGKLAEGPVKTVAFGVTAYRLTLEHAGKTLPCVFIGKSKEESLRQLRKGQTLLVLGRYAASTGQPGLTLCSFVEPSAH